jgi:hypothetical protein
MGVAYPHPPLRGTFFLAPQNAVIHDRSLRPAGRRESVGDA